MRNASEIQEYLIARAAAIIEEAAEIDHHSTLAAVSAVVAWSEGYLDRAVEDGEIDFEGAQKIEAALYDVVENKSGVGVHGMFD